MIVSKPADECLPVDSRLETSDFGHLDVRCYVEHQLPVDAIAPNGRRSAALTRSYCPAFLSHLHIQRAIFSGRGQFSRARLDGFAGLDSAASDR